MPKPVQISGKLATLIVLGFVALIFFYYWCTP